MEFKEFKKRIQWRFEKEMSKHTLFTVDVDKDEMWQLYLDSHTEEINPIFIVRRTADCSTCRHFVKTLGNVVYIQNGAVHTLWEIPTMGTDYDKVAKALDKYIKSKVTALKDIFVTKEPVAGVDYNVKVLDDGRTMRFEHLFVKIPQQFIYSSRNYDSIDTYRSEYRTSVACFKASLDLISEEALDTVLEIINQGSLYRGEEWKRSLEEFKQLKSIYSRLVTEEEQVLFVWEFCKEHKHLSRIKNHSIGVLLLDISNNMDLEVAVKRYEDIVAPVNYKRPKAIFTDTMLNKAKEDIEKLGYMDSIQRRLSSLDDISVNNILFSNKDSAKRLQGGNSLFDELSKKTKVTAKKFDHVETVSVDKFIKDILPTATEVSAYVENRHAGNFVSLIAPKNKDAKTMFKWNNNFSWSYTGNVTDSIKENVRSKGGKVDGFMRFSIQWNEAPAGGSGNDLDAHCETPVGHIYYGNKVLRSIKGELDVDIISPGNDIAVENIVFKDKQSLRDGSYEFYVHTFAYRGEKGGFRAQIELDGKVYNYNYDKSCSAAGTHFPVAIVKVKGDTVTIRHLMPVKEDNQSKEVWNIRTSNFVPVSVVMFSPNYWDEQQGIGHKHYFFMLKDCINPEEPNGFYNEYLTHHLDKHKHVMEALGRQAKVETVKDQLSGIGFSSTKRDTLVLKVKGNTERVIKVQF